MTNEEFYREHEFTSWAERAGLTGEEAFLTSTYLDKRKRTLEAGTGGGRILLELDKAGFQDLWGFDILPEFIAAAQRKPARTQVQFSVQDATALDYPNNYFEQIIYLQQIVCFVDGCRNKAINEANRILAVC